MTSAAAAAGATEITRRGRSLTGLALSSILVLLTLSLVTAIGFLLFGGKALIVRSGSMDPTIAVGDLAVTQTVTADEVRVGDIITFSDPSRDGALVTHRAQKISRKGHRIAFVTKGDANTGVERWLIEPDGTVGQFVFSIPGVGYAVSWAAHPFARLALLVAGGTLLTISALRRIWRR